MKKHILYNPHAGNEHGLERAKELEVLYSGDELIYIDLTSIASYANLFADIEDNDEIIICGGDGTLSRFVNDIDGIEIKNDILYYAIGSGNDFLHDLEKEKNSKPFRINSYIEKLPYVFINDEKRKFINGVGYGLDGFVCERGNIKRDKTKKKINYTLIALQSLLYAFSPRNATVTIDGITRHYNKVWLTPTMKGRFFGGGMMISPTRKREHSDLSVVVVHNCNRLQLLRLFPTIFKGTHIKYKKIVEIHSAKEVTIEYDKPCAMQIDGETVLNVRKYTAKAASRAAAILK